MIRNIRIPIRYSSEGLPLDSEGLVNLMYFNGMKVRRVTYGPYVEWAATQPPISVLYDDTTLFLVQPETAGGDLEPLMVVNEDKFVGGYQSFVTTDMK